MASYLRSLFGSGHSSTPAHGKAKSRTRTESTPAPSPYYVQTAPPPGTTPSTSTSGTSYSKVHRTNSYKAPAMVSSPLRYPTYDSRHSHEDSRPSLYRAASNKPHPDMHGSCHLLCPWPISVHPKLTYRPVGHTGRLTQFPQSGGYVTPGSSRSNSSSSLYPGPVHGTPFVPSPLVPSPPRSKTSEIGRAHV